MATVNIEIKLQAIDLGAGSRPCTECAYSTLVKGYFRHSPELHCLRYVVPITGEAIACVELRSDESLCGSGGVGFAPPIEWDNFTSDADSPGGSG
ncbi:MAG: hypothetical protein CTY28_15965 [Hyphomicrobium sp.]|nr:MAG: hypothetical protein CTY28_15965 [Hyphomicrobium sp.]